MSNIHRCKLSVKGTAGLPRLAPNASRIKKGLRSLRKLFMLNPRHEMCRTLFRNNASIAAERKKHVTGPYFYVIHPLSTFNSILEIVFFLVWTFSVVYEPYQIFRPKREDWYEDHAGIAHMKLVLILFFFNTGYLDTATQSIVMQPKRIIRRYLSTYFFFDILTITHVINTLSTFNHSKFEEMFQAVIYIVRISANCVRIGTLLAFLSKCLINLRCQKQLRVVLIGVIRTYIYLHMWAFVVNFIPRAYYVYGTGRFANSSWMKQASRRRAKLNRPTPALFKYIETLLMTFCYFFGITYMFEIVIPIEQACFGLLTVFGRIYSLFLLADILSLFGVVGVSEGMYESRMSIVTQYMIDMNLPENVRRRVFKFCNFKYQGQYFRENRILNTLSDNLRTEIFLFSARMLVRKVAIFKKLPTFTLGAMMASMRSETFSSGDLIIKIGTENEDIHFISTGTVAVMNSRDDELCHLEDGDVYGICCLFVRKQVYAVVAVETTEVFIINKNNLLKFFQPHPEVMMGFLRAVKLKLDHWKVLDNATETGIDIISDLQRGHILEKFTKRIMTV